MLDQSFSTQNFKKIIEMENRKGNYLEGDFFENIVEITKKIKEANSDLKRLKKLKMSSERYGVEKDKLVKIKNELKEKKEEKLDVILSKISTKVASTKFSLEVFPDSDISEKTVYKTPYKIENILTQKQLQYNFRKLYKVKQANRYSIISQMKNLLDDGFPKIILKTDIQNFYESIPQDDLLKKINDDNLLTHLSRKFIKQLFISARSKTKYQIGLTT